MTEQQDKRPHLIISDSATPEPFTSPPAVPRRRIPDCNRQQQGERLLGQLATIKETAGMLHQEREAIGLEPGFGICIQFESTEDADMPVERLSRDSQGIELLNVKRDEHIIRATIFVPEGKLQHFEKLIKQYLEEETSKGNPKNRPLVNTIEQIRAAAFEELWTDDDTALPQNEEEEIWWELWLPVRKGRIEVLGAFRRHAELLGLTASKNHLEFPERTIIAARGRKTQLTRSARLLDNIAEIRRVKETAEFFGELAHAEQQEWAEETLERIAWPKGDPPYLCLLDTGVNNGHPLLEHLLADQDLHTIEPAWSVDDTDGHGTGMAGLAAYGDLTEVLETASPIQLSHHLESVKVLRKGGDNEGKHHGYLTQEAVAHAEINAPHRKRILCTAVTSKDNRDRGRPSAWSATIDSLTSGATDDQQRLFVVAAGNMAQEHWSGYPDKNTTESIHDPGQAWNAITVGAFTEKTQIAVDAGTGYEPLAPIGGLSPHSTTSAVWNRKWPLKPDVVFEGGNVAKEALGSVTMSSLSMLTTHHQPHNFLFDYFHATSAATALAARMATQIQAVYPDLWPETIRGLLIHSAQWTEAMCTHYLGRNTNKSHFENLIRHCGFGVPDLTRALWSAGNALTLVAQDSLQPFHKIKSQYKSKDMNLHAIPWPKDALLELGETDVTMRVTLSYFIEPNPSERGFSSRYRYASYGLRFDVMRPDETVDDFRERVNRAARDEEEGTAYGGDGGGWLLGKQKRHLGSLHSDIWQGTAADLASRDHIAVYPTIGWWRERHHLKRYNKKVRYVLIVSVMTPETELDIYNEVALKIEVPAVVEV